MGPRALSGSRCGPPALCGTFAATHSPPPAAMLCVLVCVWGGGVVGCVKAFLLIIARWSKAQASEIVYSARYQTSRQARADGPLRRVRSRPRFSRARAKPRPALLLDRPRFSRFSLDSICARASGAVRGRACARNFGGGLACAGSGACCGRVSGAVLGVLWGVRGPYGLQRPPLGRVRPARARSRFKRGRARVCVCVCARARMCCHVLAKRARESVRACVRAAGGGLVEAAEFFLRAF